MREVKSMWKILKKKVCEKNRKEFLAELDLPRGLVKELVEITELKEEDKREIEQIHSLFRSLKKLMPVEHEPEESYYLYDTILYPPQAGHPHKTIQ